MDAWLLGSAVHLKDRKTQSGNNFKYGDLYKRMNGDGMRQKEERLGQMWKRFPGVLETDVGKNGGWRNRECVVKFGKIFFGLQFQVCFFFFLT